MVKKRLPIQIEPTRYAKLRRDISGTLHLGDMPRLSGQLAEARGDAEVSMAFDTDDRGFVVITVGIKATLPLCCQRSLDVFEFDVDAVSQLSPVYQEQDAQRLPAHYEPLIMTSDTVNPLDIVEDELLLLLPIVPKKRLAEDGDEIRFDAEAVTVEKHENPFNVLADLKLDKSKP